MRRPAGSLSLYHKRTEHEIVVCVRLLSSSSQRDGPSRTSEPRLNRLPHSLLLLGAKRAVAGVTQARHNVPLVVELLVDHGCVQPETGILIRQ